MWVPYYIASIVIAIILIIKDWKDVNEFLDEVSELDSLAFVKERGFFQPGSVNVIIQRCPC